MKKQKRRLKTGFLCVVLLGIGILTMMMCYFDPDNVSAGRWDEARYGEAVYGE